MGKLASPSASAQAPAQQPEPWWAAHPGKAGLGKPLAIDIHSHWSPEPYDKAIAALGHPIAKPYPLDFDLDMRKKWMDEHGVEMHVLALSGAMPWQWATPEQGARLAQILNDAAIDGHKTYPDRFVVAAEMPMRDPAMGLKELNRVAGKPGVRAVHLPDSIEHHDYLFDADFAPVLARIEQLGYPIIFHHMDGEPNAFGNRPAGPGLDAAFLHAVEATRFITSGTLDKYPKLEIVLPHAGGAFPYLAGRVEHFLYHMNAAANGTQVTLAHPFREYLRRFHYDYLIYYPEAFEFLMKLVGTDRIVVGTDSFAAKDIQYPGAVVDQFNLPAADRERILRGNATRLLHL
jgi:aminocarboxymuconate-semialdehyde decarboxylase